MNVNVTEDEITEACLTQLELLLLQQTAPKDTAAIIIEPVLGEGGYVPAPVKFLQGLREVCDKHGIMLIIDEVQSGFGRTGKNFAIEYSGVRPDILTCAKGLANGFPLSGIVSRRDLTDTLKAGSMVSNIGWNSSDGCSCILVGWYICRQRGRVCRRCCRCRRVQGREDTGERPGPVSGSRYFAMYFSSHLYTYSSKELFAALNELRSRPSVAPYILDVRGEGLMVGVEFSNKPDAPKKLASRISKRCQEKGLLILTTSVYEVIRFIPALNISQADLKKGTDIFVESVEEIVREN